MTSTTEVKDINYWERVFSKRKWNFDRQGDSSLLVTIDSRDAEGHHWMKLRIYEEDGKLVADFLASLAQDIFGGDPETLFERYKSHKITFF